MARGVASSDRRASYDIWEVEIATGAVTRLTESPGNEYGPAYGPDGRRIAYAADVDNLGVWIREANGSARRVVTVNEGAVFAPSWSPDGERIAYNHLTPGHSEMMIATVFAGSAPTRLSDPSEDVFPFRVSWTADGGTVYTSDGHISARGRDGRNRRDIDFQATVTLHRAPYTRRPRDLDEPGPSPTRGIVSPALSPDGESVAFSQGSAVRAVPDEEPP